MFTTFIQKEAQLKALEAELASMKEDSQLQKDIEFKEKLEALMKQYDASKESVLKVVAPELFTEQGETKKTRKPRKLKTYKNPHTGEILKVRGGNQNTLKAWKKEHGGDTVESWVIEGKEPEAPEGEKEPPIETKEKVEKEEAPTNSKTVKEVSVTKRKRELPIGMKPAPKGSKPKFKFMPPSAKAN
jgi:hypothetical protein